MKETIRVVAYARHHRRDEDILPQVRELFDVMRDRLGIDIFPPSLRQVALGMRLVKRYSGLINDFQQRLCNSLSYMQARRVFGEKANPIAQNWKKVRLPEQTADLLAGMGLRRRGGSTSGFQV
jgi:hypothetical protein